MSLNVKSFQTLTSMSVGEIISRSWRLYRLNFKQVIIYSIIGTPIMLLAQLLLNLPSAFSSTEDPIVAGAICCFIYPAGMSVLVLACFIAIFFNTLLIKAFFNILTGQTTEFKDILASTKEKIARMIKLTLSILLQGIPFYIIDCIILVLIMIAAIFISVFFASTLNGFSNDFSHTVVGSTILFIVFLILFVSVLIPFMVFIFYQFLFCCLQLVISSVETELSLWNCFKKSFSLIYKNFAHSMIFSLCLLTLWYVFTIYFNVPIIIYSFMEVFKEGIVPKSSAAYPIHVLFFSSLWGSISGMLIWPFITSALTLFYYDLKVKTEGFDLLTALKYQEQ